MGKLLSTPKPSLDEGKEVMSEQVQEIVPEFVEEIATIPQTVSLPYRLRTTKEFFAQIESEMSFLYRYESISNNKKVEILNFNGHR